MPATYEPIATTTLGSAAATITFSSIPATYTDLRLVLVAIAGASGNGYVPALRFNSDTGTNYSTTELSGQGSSASSARTTSSAFLSAGANSSGAGMSTTIPQLFTFDVMSYAGSTNKTVLISSAGDQNGSGYTLAEVGLWRDTTAINSIVISRSIAGGTTNFATGTTATLYGIKNA
jgi:hypothetical protein